VLAFLAEEKTVCDECGTRTEEWEREDYPYVGWTQRCKGCEALEQEKDNVGEDNRGVKVMLVPRGWAEHQEMNRGS
jgi:tRNA(Ile2) C34 agmatinyltransferase TiaS